MPDIEPLGKQLTDSGRPRPDVAVRVSREIVTLLSEQLYSSPLKAIEELVVNSFDADASVCRLAIPTSLTDDATSPLVVYDDGVGMDEAGLSDLWHVGHSNKREEVIQKQRSRQQIGKFGIGKLATYAIAHRITYVTKTTTGPLLATTLDFHEFRDDPTGGGSEVPLPVAELDPETLRSDARLRDALGVAGVEVESLLGEDVHFTVVLLEEFKPKVKELRQGRLGWVLSTAMPLRADFAVYLNDNLIESSKANFERVVAFKVGELPASRLAAITKETGQEWTTDGEVLKSPTFSSGISGEVVVTDRTLAGTKSSDLGRSHGFFVRVRGRLISIEDPLFGLDPLSYSTFNRFRADIDADDLDDAVTAPREGVDVTWNFRATFEIVLRELFYEARSRYEAHLEAARNKDRTKREHERNFVDIDLVERPVADVLSTSLAGEEHVSERADDGADADSSWFYLDLQPGTEVQSLLADLYAGKRAGTYTYDRGGLGATGRLVHFDPAKRRFTLNADHPLVIANDDEGGAKPLLEDLVTAEALLEVYLREQGMEPAAIGELLERRDRLLRNLTRDRVYSLSNIANELRDAQSDEYDLEVALVTACRALGFVAKHIAGAGRPDGVARLTDNQAGEVKMTLEAKSSAKVPSLGAIDFASLARHRKDESAAACLLVAPSYPGASLGEDAAAADMARDLKISCWTIEQLARVVEEAENRHLSARNVLSVCEQAFAPDDVAAAVDALLADPDYSERALYRAVVDALTGLEGRLPGSPRTVQSVATEISRETEFAAVSLDQVSRATSDLAGASRGALVLRGDTIVMNTSLAELQVRVASMLGEPGPGRRPGTFKAD